MPRVSISLLCHKLSSASVKPVLLHINAYKRFGVGIAGTLSGLVKRELKSRGVPEIVTLNTPDDLPAARDLIARHGEPARFAETGDNA